MENGLPILREELTSTPTPPEFGGSIDEWEEQVFLRATHFRLHRYYGKGAIDRAEVKDFEQALVLAGIELRTPGRRVLIYAINTEGRFVCLDRKRWAHYLDLWTTRKNNAV